MTPETKKQLEDTWFRIGRMAGLLSAREIARDIQDTLEARAIETAVIYDYGARYGANLVYEAIVAKAEGHKQGAVPSSREEAVWDQACTIVMIVEWLRNCAAATEVIPMAIGVHDAKSAFEYAAKTIESGAFWESAE